jgi:hypothetical protein
MRYLIAIVLVGCGGSGGGTDNTTDDHDLVQCMPGWEAPMGEFANEQCELACQKAPATFGSGTCNAQLDGDPSGMDPADAIMCTGGLSNVGSTGVVANTSSLFTFNGTTGCCVAWNIQTPVQFAECE